MDLQYTSQRAHPKNLGRIRCGGALGRRCCRWACRTASAPQIHPLFWVLPTEPSQSNLKSFDGERIIPWV